MSLIFDIHGTPVSRWIHQLVPKNVTSPLYCVPESQLLHLGLPVSRPFSFLKLTPPITWCSACVTQCRAHKYVSITRGETCDINITSPYLSIGGKPLTYDHASLERLSSRSQYNNPFWITSSECAMLSHHLSHIFDYFSVRHKFTDPRLSTEVLDLSNKRVYVVNVEEVFSKSNSMTLLSCLSLFRPFEPFNISSRKRFLPSTELLIRSECWRTCSWCSVWGTEEDFNKVGVQCLDGAICLQTFNEYDDEVALTNALRTTNSAQAYRLAFPHNHLTFTS